MPGVDGLTAALEDRVEFLHDVIGWETACARTEVHRAAARVEPDADLGRSGDLGAEDIATVTRDDVVVVGARGAPGADEVGQGALGSDVDGIGVDATPDRVERGEPLEEGVIDREPRVIH